MTTTNHLRISGLALALALAAVVLALVAKPALAATINVNATGDVLEDNGDCTLREAIIAANTNAKTDACPAGGSGTDTINVPGGSYRLTIPTTSDAEFSDERAATGDLDIMGPTTITGAGAHKTTVSADSSLGSFNDRIFEILETTTTIRGLTIQDGNGSPGGGVENNAGTLTLDKVAIIQNVSTRGGGVASFGNSLSDTLTITNSTVWANQSTSDSNGGVIQEGGTAVIKNSTISGNVGRGVTATDFDTGDDVGHIMNIQNSTIANNNTSDGLGGGGIRANGSSVGPRMVVNVKNTIVSDNDPDNCLEFGGVINSQGNNIDSANTCGFALATDKPNTDPLLGPLQPNGGPTWTRALLQGSPAINAGGRPFPPKDQRGVKRPQGKRSDIGAYEKKR